jgi:hypothetical protein
LSKSSRLGEKGAPHPGARLKIQKKSLKIKRDLPIMEWGLGTYRDT